MHKIKVALAIAYNWAWLRVYVFFWLAKRGRLHQFTYAIQFLEAQHNARVRRLLWELTKRGEVRREYDPEDGEYRYFPKEDAGE